MAILHAFDAFIAFMYHVMITFQGWVEPIFGSQSYWISIVMLTLAVRILLIPLTVKQVRSMRAMSELAPELKKLQAKYKNDKQKLQEEMMALYRERGVNPFMGCLPLVAQLPFFYAIFRVFYYPIVPGTHIHNALYSASFFGIPLTTRWIRLPGLAAKLGTVDGLVILAMIIAMALTTYISQRQLMARQSSSNPALAQQQMLMKLMPLMFVVFAINFPLAVLIYWITTNLWSMGQQWYLLRDYGAQPAAAGATGADAAALIDGTAEGKGEPTPKRSEARSTPRRPASGARPRTSGAKKVGFLASLRQAAERAQASRDSSSRPSGSGAKSGAKSSQRGNGRPSSTAASTAGKGSASMKGSAAQPPKRRPGQGPPAGQQPGQPGRRPSPSSDQAGKRSAQRKPAPRPAQPASGTGSTPGGASRAAGNGEVSRSGTDSATTGPAAAAGPDGGAARGRQQHGGGDG